MKLTYSGNLFLWRSSYGNRIVAQQAGFTWSQVLKAWVTSYSTIANRLRQYADDVALSELNKRNAEQPIELPEGALWPSDFTPKQSQLDGLKWAASRKNSLLRHDPGMGKTAIVAMLMNLVPGRVLIICPPFLKINWRRELVRLVLSNRTYTIIEKGDFAKYNLNADVLIMPDSLMTNDKLVEAIRFQHQHDPFAICAVDEPQRYKTPTAIRTRAVFGGVVNNKRYKGLSDCFTKHRVLLSGTPMPARPIELWNMLICCAPEVIDFKDRFQYAKEYCGAYFDGYGWNLNGASKQEILNAKLCEQFMHVAKKGSDFVEKTVENVLVPETEMSKSAKNFEREMLEEYDLEDIQLEALGKMAAHRKELGVTKVGFAKQFVSDILENTNESVLVFAWHKDVIKQFAEEMKKFEPFVITGETPNVKRQEYVDEFQNNAARRLFVGNIQAMGVGLTLTKASRVVFIEYSWTPADNDQAEDRAHRIGQTQAVFVQYLVVENSIDEWVLESLMSKKKNINRIIG